MTEPDAGEPDAGTPKQPRWASAGPAPGGVGRWGSRMVAVSNPDRFILLGGSTYPAGGTVGDVWSYSLATGAWTELTTTGDVPPPRYCHCMVYLPVQQQVLVIGGRNDNGPRPLEAFTLDVATNVWARVNGPYPPGVIGCVAQWMPNVAGGRAIVFGGDNVGGVRNETWSYDPVARSFTRLITATSPPGRRDPASAYDPRTGRLAIFGGAIRVFPPYAHLNDLWDFDGTNWREITPLGSPEARRFPAEGFDPGSGMWMMFGGTNDQSDYGDLWTLELAILDWRQHSTAGGPGKRGFPASAWHEPTRTMYLFGGLSQPNYVAHADGWKLTFE